MSGTSGEPEWAALPGACFIMGQAGTYPEEGPPREVCVDGFEIALTEVTNGQYAAFVEATGYVTRAEQGWRADDPTGPGLDVPPGSAKFIMQALEAGQMPTELSWWRYTEGISWRDGLALDPQMPVVHLTREDAEAYAAWADARLPTEAEWEYAARGGLDGTLYAWDEAEAESTAAMANTWQGFFPALNTAEDGYAGLAPVAQFPPNGFGLYDMIGNAWEWTSSDYTATHQPGTPTGDPNQPDVEVGVIKGGSFLCATNYCYRFRPAARQAQDLVFGTSHVGFRIVRD